MSSAKALLGALTARGVRLSAADGQLRFKALPGVLTAEDKDALRAHKAELCALLEGRTAMGLSSVQRRLWFLSRLAPRECAYLVSEAFVLRGPLKPEILEQALQRIVARHEALRATFVELEGQVAAMVLAQHEVPLRRLRLQGAPSAQAIQDALREELTRPFNLAHEPPVRSCLLEITPEHHVWALGLHHLVADGWSLGLLHEELSALYREGSGVLGAEKADLTALSLGYADFVDWERQVHASSISLPYWRERLTGLPSLELPCDFPRPAITRYEGRQHRFSLPKETDAALASLAAEAGATPFAVWLAVFAVTLQRFSRQRDIAIGTPHANRNDRGFEPIIGCLVATLVARVDLSRGVSFRELIRAIHRDHLGASEHQDVAFEDLVALAGQTRDASRSPLFQVFFAYQNVSRPLQLAGVDVEEFPFDPQLSQFEVELHLSPDPNGMRGLLLVSAALFSAGFAPRFAEAFATLASHLAKAPDAPVDEACLLSKEAAQHTLLAWNRTAHAYPRELCLHEWVRERLEQTPDAVVARWGEHSLTGAELLSRAHGIANALANRGIGPGHFVALLGERSLDLLCAMLGVLAAGAAYLPLDPELPEERLRFMLEDSQARLLVSAQPDVHRAPEGLPLVGLAELASLRAEAPPRFPMSAELPAYLLYTSGSTGRPKGVVVRHRNVVSCLWAHARAPGLGPSDRMLAVTTWSFDISVLELFLPLVTGALLVIATQDEVRDGKRLAELLEGRRITAMQGTPATWSLLMSAGFRGMPRLKVFCGGEHPPREIVDWLLKHCGQVWNLYGPTETTIWSLRERLQPGEPILIGRPLENTQIYVLDEQGLPVGPYVPGELYIGGEGVAAGYWQRPELTAERFVERNPGGLLPKPVRLYRTGDLVKQREDGRVEFLGRLDEQVKIRGYRIETGEIEAVLGKHPALREVAVVARPGPDGALELIACMSTKPGEAPAITELRAWLMGRLPAYMVPSVFVVLEALPRTPNGKIHRKALPPASFSRRAAEVMHEEPLGAMEQAVAALFAELLPGTKPGRSDDFFALGGHSLMAARLLHAASERLFVSVPMTELFLHPTVRAFALVLKRAQLKSALDRGDMAALEAAIAELSEEEAETLLSQLRP